MRVECIISYMWWQPGPDSSRAQKAFYRRISRVEFGDAGVLGDESFSLWNNSFEALCIYKSGIAAGRYGDIYDSNQAPQSRADDLTHNKGRE